VIFLDTNVISETLRRSPSPAVMNWLAMNDDSLAIPTVTIAEIAYGIAKIQPDPRSDLLQSGLDARRQRFTGRIFGLTENAALVYEEITGNAHRAGSALSAPDGMIASIAIVNDGRLATRNTRDFTSVPVDIVNPWDT
jgi:predicted nucleic acid-binding protein